MKPSLERVKELLDYDPGTGVFRWKFPHRRIKVGDVAGRTATTGYRSIGIDGQSYQASHLAYFIAMGLWPQRVDHRDLNKANDALDNLRPATPHQNNGNVRVRSHNHLGLKGVRKKGNKYQARIGDGRRYRSLGYFKTPEEASRRYCAEARRVFGEFARCA